MIIENRLTPLFDFPDHVQLDDDDVIALTVTLDEAFIGVAPRLRPSDAVPESIYYGRTREIVLTARVGNRTAKISDAIELVSDFDLIAHQMNLSIAYHGHYGDLSAARDEIENREHSLIYKVEDRVIDSDEHSCVTVWSAGDWLEATDERENLKFTDGELLAQALSDNVILIDVEEWREEAAARLEP